MQATARIYFQKAPAKRTRDDLCPVKLCVTHRRERRYYSVSKQIRDPKWMFLSPGEIKRVKVTNPRGKYRSMAFEYRRISEEAGQLINGIGRFSFGQFEERFLLKPTAWDNVFSAMIDHVKTLKAEERFGYAATFDSTLGAIKEYHTGRTLGYSCRDKVETRYNSYLSGKPLNFADITPKWLRGFETWLLKRGKSKSTLGVYVRNIRVIFNVATRFHQVKAESPFKNHRPKTSSGRKIALTAHEVSLIANYSTESLQGQFYRDIFMFSFLSCGMNLSDIARLRYSDIVDGELCFVRQKTKNEEARESKLYAPVTRTMQAIIDRHGNKAVGHDAYIFPIFKPEWDEKQRFDGVKQLVKQTNKYVRRIALTVGINENVSSYCARHSFATIAKNSGTSVEFISEALGHSSVNVTRDYLKSFERATREEHSDMMENKIYGQAVM